MLSNAGLPIVDAHIVSIGGGLGSLALVDFLRIAGVGTRNIKVLSNLSAPHESFAALSRASQLKPENRLRSDSSSRIDNIWGWPGYALSEAIAERTLAPLLRVFTEPLFCEYFTPRLRTVLAGLEREADRIGWKEMLVCCRAEIVRPRRNGGYFVLAHLLGGEGEVVYRCQHVHLALGHSRPRLLPDLVAFRERHGGAGRIVNSYEPHEEVYRCLIQSPGFVVLRGAGITASRVLERLAHDRDRFGVPTKVLHLVRHYVEKPTGPPWFRRPAGNGFSYQPFSFPKAAGGGQLRQRMLRLSGQERARLTMTIGGTTTAYRREWRRQLERGREQGWYEIQTGVVVGIHSTSSGKLSITLSDSRHAERMVEADFLIDATGLESDALQHTLLADLVDNGGACLNALGQLDVEPSFEVRGTRSGAGRMYASGAATLGGALAPVDSFWGLTHAAMEICDDLAAQSLCEFPSVLRSVSQWWRWMRNQRP